MRTKISYLLLASFVSFLVLFALLSEFFQDPQVDIEKLQMKSSLGSEIDRNGVIKVGIKTPHLERTFVSKQTAGGVLWKIDGEAALQLRSERIQQIFDFVQQLEVQKIFKSDEIDLETVALDRPEVSLTLWQKGKAKPLKISLGLSHPLEQAMYVLVNGSPQIHQLKLIPQDFAGWRLKDLVEPRLFPWTVEQLKRVGVQRYFGRVKRDIYELNNESGVWKVQGELPASWQPEVVVGLKMLIQASAYSLVDQVDEKRFILLEKIFDQALALIEVETLTGERVQFELSSKLTRSGVEELQLPEGEYLILRVRDGNYLWVVEASFARLLLEQE